MAQPFEDRFELVEAMIRTYAPSTQARYLMAQILGMGMFQILPDDDKRNLQEAASQRFATKIARLPEELGITVHDAELRKQMDAIMNLQTIVLFDRELDRPILLWDRDVGDVVDELYKGTAHAS